MAAAKPNYIAGHEYNLGDGNTAVWGGKRGWMKPDEYLDMKGQGQTAFDDNVALSKRLDDAKAMIKGNDGRLPFPLGLHVLGTYGLGSNTGFMGGVGAGEGAPSWSPLKSIPGSPGLALDKKLLPVRANNFVKNLQTMRNNSPTGGAVGNVSDAEGEKLSSLDASLSVSQPKADLLEEIATQHNAFRRHMPGLSAVNPIDIRDTPGGSIPQGAYFRAANGIVYRNQKGADGISAAPTGGRVNAPSPPRVMARPAAAPVANGGWSITPH